MRILYEQDDTAGAGDATAVAEPSWRDTLPDEIKSDKSISEMEDVSALAKSYIHAREKATAQGVIIPGKGASEGEFNEFYTKLGRPPTAAEYELPQDGMPEGFQQDDARLKTMQEKAFALGITKQQFAGLVRADAEVVEELTKTGQTAQEAQRAEWQSQIKEKLGAAFEQDLNLAKSAVMSFGGEELRTLLNESGLGDHPAMVTAFAAIGRAVAEDEVIGRGRGVELIPNKAEANKEILTLQADDKFMRSLEKRSDPGHELAVKRWRELHAQANPEPEVAA